MKFSIIILFVSSLAFAGTELKLLKGTIKTAELLNKSSLMTSTESTVNGAADFVIQYKNAISEVDKALLRTNGVIVFRYLPEDALIVRAERSVLDQLPTQTANINAVIPYQAAWKLSDNLPILSVFSVGKKEAILITAFLAEDKALILAKILSLDPAMQVISNEERYLSVYIESSLLPKVAKFNGVEFIEKMESMQPLHIDLLEKSEVGASVAANGDYSDLTGYETGTKVIGMDAAWSQGFIGEGQSVAMADTGLDVGDVSKVSSDFQGAVRSGYSFGVGAKNWSDPMGHGTHVAGSVLGRGTFSGGKLKGAAFGSMFVAEGMWSPILDNLTVPPQLSKLFEPAYNDGARIHTNSWGAAGNFGSYDAMAQKVDEFMWSHPDFLILYAAGNSGVDKNKDGKIDPNSIGSPGTSKNCLTVGASENIVSVGGIQKKISELRTAKDSWPAEPIWSSKISDNANGMAMFSSRGPTKDNRLKPEIVAPGTNILSARSHQEGAELLWGAYNDNYLWSGGTSMATPLAAGFASVTREILVKRHGIAQPSAALVKAVMMHTAFDMYPGQYGEGGSTQELSHRPNNDEGYGRVDMGQVLSLKAKDSHLIDSTSGVGQGEVFEQTINAQAGQSLHVNLAYTDAPGTPAAGQALVNNLDLIVLTPSGEELGSKDTVNNSEIIELNQVKLGTYKIQVRGTKIPMGKNGKQPFALVYTVH